MLGITIGAKKLSQFATVCTAPVTNRTKHIDKSAPIGYHVDISSNILIKIFEVNKGAAVDGYFHKV